MAAFAFLPEIPIDRVHTLDQLTGRFQSVKDGLPELVKNSKDQYARLNVPERAARQIVVLLNSKAGRLGVLDFAGAKEVDFEGWITWSSRTANRKEMASDIEAGHGNGGKAFMVRGCSRVAFMDSCSGGMRTKMGFQNDDPKVRYYPGYARLARRKIKSLPDANPARRLATTLKEFGVVLDDLPEAARKAFNRRNAFTIVQLDEVREWRRRKGFNVHNLIDEVAANLAAHAQASLTIETCTVWVMIDGKIDPNHPIQAEYPEPLEGFEHIDAIPVPNDLPDPKTGESVSTGPSAKDKLLQLRTSDKHLRMSDHSKPLNVIRVRNDRNVAGQWSLAELAPRAESAFILGEVRVGAVKGEHVAGADRIGFADTPLVRALEAWVAKHVEELADKIQRANAKESKQEDRDKANATLSEFRELMREFLSPAPIPGADEGEGKGEGDQGQGTKKKKRHWQLGTRVDEIALEAMRPSIALAVGTRIPLYYRCYEVDSGGTLLPVINADVEMVADVPGVVQFDSRDGTLKALASGSTKVRLRDRESGVESEMITVEAVSCTGVDIVGPTAPLLKGQRISIVCSFHTAAGHRTDLLIDGAVDEDEMGRLSRGGFFTAGQIEGAATVRVRFGAALGENSTTAVEIGSESVKSRGQGGGSDIPLILMCGDPAPGMEEYPPDQRTHHGGDHHPTIIEDPLFPNVVWINPHSKEAVRVRRRGPSGISGIANKVFAQFLALKCFDILSA